MSPMEGIYGYAASWDNTGATDYYEYVLLTVEEAARVLNLTEQAIRARASRGTLTGIKLDGTSYVRLAVV